MSTWDPILSTKTTKSAASGWQPITSVTEAQSFNVPTPPAAAPEPAPAPAPSLGSAIWNAVKDTGGQVFDSLKTFLGGAAEGYQSAAAAAPPKTAFTSFNNMYDALDAGANSLVSTIKDSGQKLADFEAVLMDPNSDAVRKIASGGEAALGVINGLFTIVTAPLAGISTIPVVGSVADKVNEVMAAIGGGFSASAVTALNDLPISEEHKQQLRPLVGDLAALVGQAVVGGKAGEVLPDIVAKAKHVTNTIADGIKQSASRPEAKAVLEQTPIPQAKPIEPIIKPEVPRTGTTPHDEYARSQGYEPYTPDANLPEIQTGPKYKNGLPTIQTAELPRASKVKGDLTYVPEPKPVFTAPDPAFDQVMATEAPKTAKAAAPAKLPGNAPQLPTPKIEKTATTKASKIGQSIEAKAVEDKLTKGFGETAQYDPITIKDQSEKATNLINSNPELARAIVRGDEPLPQGLRGTALITAMEEYVKKNPNADVAYELANSPLTSTTSAAAQELRLAAERAPDSAIVRIQDIKRARENDAGPKPDVQKRAILKTLKSETEKVNLSKEDLSWNKFLEEITC